MLKWNDLFTQGTLIYFSEHMWRARLQLKAADLGVPNTEEVKKALSFGGQRLADKGEFKTLEKIARQWKDDIDNHSLNFPLLDGVRFVPDDQVPILTGKLENHRKAFDKEVKAFIKRYDEIKAKQLPILEQALKDAAHTPEAAYAAYRRVEVKYPSPEAIAEKFDLEWSFFTLQLPTSKAAVKAAKESVPQVKKMVESMVVQLRDRVSKEVENLISIAGGEEAKKKGGFREKSIAAVNEALDKVDALNIFGDNQLSQQTKVLRRALADSASGSLLFDDVVEKLVDSRQILETDKQKAIEAAEKKLTGIGDRKLKWK